MKPFPRVSGDERCVDREEDAERDACIAQE
jgi:hypothetical protein